MAKGFDAPPTLERSGSEHRVGRFPPSSLREERLGEKGGAFLKGKEGRVGFRKKITSILLEKHLSSSIRKDFQSPSAPHVSYPFPKDLRVP